MDAQRCLAFAIPTKQGTLDWPDSGREILKRLVGAVRGRTKVVLSVGEYAFSDLYSDTNPAPWKVVGVEVIGSRMS